MWRLGLNAIGGHHGLQSHGLGYEDDLDHKICGSAL